jgi:hypothetical protein
MISKQIKSVIVVVAVMMLVVAGFTPLSTAFAQSGVGFDQHGTITEVNTELGVVTVLGADGTTYYIPVSATQIASLSVGAAIEIHGTVAADGTLTFGLDDSIFNGSDDSVDGVDDHGGDDACEQALAQNAVAADLIANGGADPDVLEELSCEFGLDWTAISDIVAKAELNSIDPIFYALAGKAGLADALVADLATIDMTDPKAVDNLLDQYHDQIKDVLGSDDIDMDDDSDFAFYDDDYDDSMDDHGMGDDDPAGDDNGMGDDDPAGDDNGIGDDDPAGDDNGIGDDDPAGDDNSSGSDDSDDSDEDESNDDNSGGESNAGGFSMAGF